MPQTINNINPEHYQDNYNKQLIKMADQENLWSRFMLGEKIDTDKFLHTFFMQDKVCVKSCSMLEYIWKAIKEELKEDCPEKHEGFYTVQKVYEQKTEKKEPCEAVGNCTAKIEW